MTGPADDGELTVKLLNSGSPAVMMDLEDSTANIWEHIMLAVKNTIAAYKYELSYDDKKRQKKSHSSAFENRDLGAPAWAAPQPGWSY